MFMIKYEYETKLFNKTVKVHTGSKYNQFDNQQVIEKQDLVWFQRWKLLFDVLDAAIVVIMNIKKIAR